MSSAIRLAGLPALGLMIVILCGCGGGGGESATAVSDAGAAAPAAAPNVSPPAPVAAATPAPAPVATPVPTPVPTPADLSDAKNAIRLASAMIEATYLSTGYYTEKWSEEIYKVKSRTELSGCTTTIYTNADGLPNAGDQIESRDANCSYTIPDGSWVGNRRSLGTLSSISDSRVPLFAAWTVSEESSKSGTVAWDILVTTDKYRFKGQGSFEKSSRFEANHKADGTQQDSLISWKIAAKGAETSGAYDFAIDSSLSCSYAAGQSLGTCTNGAVTLKGTLNGVPADASMIQTSASPPTFEIIQGNQKLKVTRSEQSFAYTITTAGGIPLVTSLLYLISGYY